METAMETTVTEKPFDEGIIIFGDGPDLIFRADDKDRAITADDYVEYFTVYNQHGYTVWLPLHQEMIDNAWVFNFAGKGPNGCPARIRAAEPGERRKSGNLYPGKPLKLVFYDGTSTEIEDGAEIEAMPGPEADSKDRKCRWTPVKIKNGHTYIDRYGEAHEITPELCARIAY